MIRKRIGIIKKIILDKEEYQFCTVEIGSEIFNAVNYPLLTGSIKENDQVLLNTTAVSLNLGTGGCHFIIANLAELKSDCSSIGHIIKMRYTPQQVKVLAVEEEASPYHEELKKFSSLNKTPVIIAFLHSMLIPIIAGIKALKENARICYIMTDGGALPLMFSRTVRVLKEKNLTEGIITAGHAFGGDLEAVNIYSALAAAYTVYKPDIIIVAMGPGIVGTGTELGTTALEVGQIINAVCSLEGTPVVTPRINFCDYRSRHSGISHHVFTVLEKIALVRSTVVFPILENRQRDKLIKKQIDSHNISVKHNVVFEDGKPGMDFLEENKLKVTTMGKSLIEENEFFLTACASGTFTAKLI